MAKRKARGPRRGAASAEARAAIEANGSADGARAARTETGVDLVEGQPGEEGWSAGATATEHRPIDPEIEELRALCAEVLRTVAGPARSVDYRPSFATAALELPASLPLGERSGGAGRWGRRVALALAGAGSVAAAWMVWNRSGDLGQATPSAALVATAEVLAAPASPASEAQVARGVTETAAAAGVGVPGRAAAGSALEAPSAQGAGTTAAGAVAASGAAGSLAGAVAAAPRTGEGTTASPTAGTTATVATGPSANPSPQSPSAAAAETTAESAPGNKGKRARRARQAREARAAQPSGETATGDLALAARATQAESHPSGKGAGRARGDEKANQAIDALVKVALSSGKPGKEPVAPKEEPEERATLGRDAILAGMKPVAKKVKECYRQYKERGTANVHVEVGPRGQVSRATVAGPFAGTDTGSCVERAVKAAARFPASAGMTFDYPFPLR